MKTGTQTLQSYISPGGNRGHIQTPFPSSSFQHTRHAAEQHRTERRSQPYTITLTHLHRGERQRRDPYYPIREAEDQGGQNRRRRSRSRSPVQHVRFNRGLSLISSTVCHYVDL